jgi:hypothetical protein
MKLRDTIAIALLFTTGLAAQSSITETKEKTRIAVRGNAADGPDAKVTIERKVKGATGNKSFSKVQMNSDESRDSAPRTQVDQDRHRLLWQMNT